MEQRTFAVRLADNEARMVEGVAVPYGQTIDLGAGVRERFARGAFGTPQGVKLLWQHREPIGRVEATDDGQDGFRIRAYISKTPRGDEAMTLLRDGVIDKFSVGFTPVLDERDADGVIVRTQANLHEVSLVTFPAYEGAAVTAVREEPMNPETEEIETPIETESEAIVADAVDVEAREGLAELERRMAVLSTTTPQGSTTPQYRSFGEFVAHVAKGDTAAMNLYADLNTRAFAGGVAGATASNPDSINIDAWVKDSVRILDFGRPTMNAFRTVALPSEGLNIEYPEVATNAIAVGQQAAEADVLAYGKISLRSKTSPVVTYGGYTAMSRQAIERSSYGYLDTVMRAMTVQYAKATNQAVVTALTGATGMGSATAAATSAGWIGAVADSAEHIYKNAGLSPEFVLCSLDVYKKIVKLVDGTDRGAVASANPQNNTGSANIPGLQATLLGLPVIVDPALATGACWIANSQAFETYESAGAPFRLSDQDITNLTAEFSVYGYMATALVLPGALVKVTAS